jgi:hypothetical protein
MEAVENKDSTSPISMAMLRSLWERCGLRKFHLAVRFFGSSRTFIGNSPFFFVFETDVIFLTRSATFRLQPTTSCRLTDDRQCLEVKNEGLLKNFIIIFVFHEMFFVFHFLMLRFYSKKDSSRFAGELH